MWRSLQPPSSFAILFLALPVGCSTGTIHSSFSSPSPPSVTPSSGAVSSNPYWAAPSIGSTNSLGTVSFPANGQGPVQLLSPTIMGSGGPLAYTEASWNSAWTVLTITYTMGTTTLHVTVQITGTSAGIQAQLDADQPVITEVDFGKWASHLSANAIIAPYYTGSVWYAEGLSSFLNVWWDWHSTQATQFSGTVHRENGWNLEPFARTHGAGSLREC